SVSPDANLKLWRTWSPSVTGRAGAAKSSAKTSASMRHLRRSCRVALPRKIVIRKPSCAPCHSASLRYVAAMKLDKFTVKAQEALQDAQSVARRRDHQEILPEHVLAALLAQQDGLVGPLLQRIGADPHLVQARLDDE